MGWTPSEKEFLFENIGKLSFEQIAEELGKSKNAVHLFIHRARISYKPTVHFNLIKELLTIVFKNPEFFSPTKDFFEDVKITQIRFWKLYRGEENPTEKEYKILREYFNVSKKEIIGHRQLEIF